SICLFASPICLFAQNSGAGKCPSGTVPVRYSAETELVAVVCHLAGIGGYAFDEEDGVLPDYLADVDSSFAPYRNHKAVTFAGKKLYRKGFAWDMPMAFAMRFSLDDGKIVYRKGLETDFDDFHSRLGRADEKKFIRLLEDFYKDSSFGEFFENHRGVYAECEEAMRKVVDKIDLGWYDSFFGPNDGVEFCVYLGLLNGPGNFAIHQKFTDGKEVVNALMGCCDRDSEGMIHYGEVYTLPVLVHEFNHSYCNPLNEEFWGSIEAKATALFNANASFYNSIAYGSPELIMNEMFVEASMLRYLMSHPVDLEGSGFESMDELIERLILIDEKRKKFVLVRPLMEVLGRREAESATYPTMRDFMPEYAAAVNK
ncbi:MAG: DUF4932 domain-containing protein, partial [Candidatus Cryptobacteroides sp.]